MMYSRMGALLGFAHTLLKTVDGTSCPINVFMSVVVQAGAVLFGKTNMDQFAAGLVGTRTPYGVAPNAFDDR